MQALLEFKSKHRQVDFIIGENIYTKVPSAEARFGPDRFRYEFVRISLFVPINHSCPAAIPAPSSSQLLENLLGLLACDSSPYDRRTDLLCEREP